MKTALYILCLCLLAQPVLAEKAPSVMFDPPEQSITGTPSLENPSGGDHCEDLLQKIEQLKGKPQRKHSMMERYELECAQPQ
jgi:hypothetical protein